MKSFQKYLKEQEELALVKVEEDKRQKLADFIRKIDDLNDEKFHRFAIEELGMEEPEAETLAYKMLKAFLLANDKNQDGIPDTGVDELEDALGGEVEDLGDEMGDEDGLGGEEDEDMNW